MRSRLVTWLKAREDDRWKNLFEGNLEIVDAALEDVPLRLGCGADEVFWWPDVRDVGVRQYSSDVPGDHIRNLIQGLEADAVLLPLALGRHVDHVAATDAVLDHIDIDRTPLAFYEDLPHAARPDAATQITEGVKAMGFVLKPGFINSATEIMETEQFKFECASVYSSQSDAAETEMIANFGRRYKGRERIWATPCWQSSGPRWVKASAAGTVR